MNVALWIVQGLLGAMFLFSGGMKVFNYEKYKKMIESRDPAPGPGFSKAFMQFIGVCELAGGLGLILPGALMIAPFLTAWAALGLGVIMLGATIFHVRRKEPPVMTAVLLMLCAFVVYGRGFA